MKIQDLISKLQSMPQNLEVHAMDDDGCYVEEFEVDVFTEEDDYKIICIGACAPRL